MKSRLQKNLGFVLGLALTAGVLGAASPAPAFAHNQGGGAPQLTPVVIFPAFHFTRLKVTVQNQTVDPQCPASGTFEDFYPNSNPSPTFNQVCQDKMLTLQYDRNFLRPMEKRFSNPKGVTVEVYPYGLTQSAPAYEKLYLFLESNGYVRNQSIRVAGFDSRLTPEIGDFLRRSIDLIEDTYYDNGRTPVHLIAHSNGPLYTQYLLTHTSQAWKKKFLHGFTPIAGNWPGQGFFYGVLFTGFNVSTFTFPATAANALSSARMYQSHPSSYMSAADPAIFGDDEVVVENLSNGREYTPRDNQQLFYNAGLPVAAELARHYIGFVKFATPLSFPYVDIYAEKGSNIPTAVGLRLQGLTVGQVFPSADPTLYINRLGDVNQEDITNDSIQVWENMACYRFSLTDNDGIDHFTLPDYAPLHQRLLTNLNRTKSSCWF